MASGLSLAIRVNNGGGASVDKDSAQLAKLLVIALRPCPSANPFQDLGLASDIIFRINEASIEGEVSLEIERIFSLFESANRARLVGVPTFTRPKAGELQADITYIDLEQSRQENLSLILAAVLAEGGG